MTALLFVLAGALGAVGRHVVGRLVCTWQSLIVVNTAGAALLGWLIGQNVSSATLTVLGVGLCGALTTFGSFVLEARRLGPLHGAVFTASMMVCVTGAASIGTSW